VAATGGAAPASPGYRAWVLAALVVVYTFNFIDRQILSILLQPIKEDLGLSDTSLGFLTGFAFAIFYATLGIPIAMLADRWNRRTIISIALALWSGMTALSGLVTSFWQLAAARIGVGIGEAGGSPPAYSLISDYFPPERRATALAVYSMGLPFGILLGFLIGGWVNDLFDWRTAFFVVGLPGLLFAIVFRLTVREPERGAVDPARIAAPAPPLAAVLAFLWSQGSLRHVVIGTTLIAFANYGFLTWTPAFLIRSHGLSVSATGTILALVIGVSGAIGMLAAGWGADRLARRDARWMVWLPALAVLANAPGVAAMVLAGPVWLACAVMAVPAAMGMLYLGPVLSLMQTLVAPRMRAVSGAFFLFVVNLVGMGLGPQAVGLLSDLLAPRFGADSLRYALLIGVPASVWAAAHYWLAARHLEGDRVRLQALAAA
jgi:predicted MFS family arabinose efflux permease